MKALIFLAALVVSVSAALATPQQQNLMGSPSTVVLAEDTFVRANSSSLGSNWTAFSAATSSCSISSNTVIDPTTTSSTFCGALWTATTPISPWPNDQCGGILIGALNDSNAVLGVAIRMQSNLTGYVGYVIGPLSGPSVSIVKYNAAASTQVLAATSVGAALNVGDSLGFCMKGSNYYLWIEHPATGQNIFWNGTDSTYTSGSPGLVIPANGGAAGDGAIAGWIGLANYSAAP